MILARQSISRHVGRRRLRRDEGFTLMEMIIVMALLGVMVALGVQAMRDGKRRAHFAARDASFRTLVEASIRATLDGITPDPGVATSNKDAVIDWYVEQRLLLKRPVYTEGLAVVDGKWSVVSNDEGPPE